MRANPFRLRVMTALTELLEGITPDAGYDFDLSRYEDQDGRPRERVFRGRDIFGTSDPLPLLAVLENPESNQSNNGSDAKHAKGKFDLIIQGFVNGGDIHPLDAAYHLSASVIERLSTAKVDRTFEGPSILGFGSRAPCIHAMTIGQPVHRPGGDTISDNAYFVVGVSFALIENIARPFD